MRLKRLLALLIALCMWIIMLPDTAFAAQIYPAITPGSEHSATITSGGQTGYFTYKPAYTEEYIFYSAGDSDTVGYLYDSNMTLLTQSGGGAQGDNFLLIYTLEAGQAYILGVAFEEKDQTGSISVMLEIEHTWNEEAVCGTCGAPLFEKGICGENLSWTLDATGTLTVTGTGKMTDYADKAPWFTYRNFMKTVVIQQGVTSIGDYAFYACDELQEVMLPESLEIIGASAFLECSNLNNIIIPAGVTEIGEEAFFACTGLTSAEMDGTITQIGDQAFAYCVKLQTILFMGSAPVSIGEAVFEGVTANAYYPGKDSTWTDSKIDSFGGHIKWIVMTDECASGNHSFTEYISDGNATCKKNGTKTAKCDHCGAQKTVEEAGSQTDHAFTHYLYDAQNNTRSAFCDYGCGTENITAGYPVITAGMEYPVAITNGGEIAGFLYTPAYTEEYIFRSVGNSDTTGYLYDAEMNLLTQSEGGAQGDNFSLTHTLEAGKKYILCAAFEETDATGSFSVLLENCHTWNEEFVCSVCGAPFLEKGTCGENLTWSLDDQGTLIVCGTGDMIDYTSGNKAPWFTYAKLIRQVVIQQGVTGIGDYAFYACDAMTAITMPEGVVSIGNSAFSYCSGITEITLPQSLQKIGASAFSDCGSLLSIAIPNGVTVIEEETFLACMSLGSVVLPETIVRINPLAFTACINLTSITIPGSISEIGDTAFTSCIALATINFEGDAPDSIGEAAFAGVTAEVTYPSGNSTWTEQIMQDYGGDLTWIEKLSWLPGDVTGDGKVDIKDYSRILSHVKKLNVFTDPQILSCADVTGDGKVDIKDYSRVLAHCKKLNPLF